MSQSQSLQPTTDTPVSEPVFEPEPVFERATRRGIRAQGLSPDSLWTQVTAAEYLSVNGRTLRRLIQDGQLPAVRVGSRLIRVRRSDVEKLLTRIPVAS